MTGPGAFGLVWGEAEIDLPAWQGIRALGFTAVPPAGVAAELRVELARPASGLVPGDIAVEAPEGAAHLFQALVTDGDPAILVRFAQPASGRLPRGAHRLRLDSGGADPLHPFFASAGFDFYIDCPGGDCRATPEADAPAATAEPAIDLATKDYRGFLKVALDWARATDPNWTDLSPASVEATLIEALSHQAEMLSLYQDRVAQEAFIDTARERFSLTRHAELLGVRLDEGAAATTTVAVDIGAPSAGYLPAGTPLERREAGGRVSSRFRTSETVLLDSRWNAGLSDSADAGLLRPAAWPGADDAVLPAGATGLLLLGHDLGLAAGQRIALVQGATAHVATLIETAEIAAPGWTADPGDAPTTAPADVTRIAWDAPTAQPFAPWIDPAVTPFLVSANLVEAQHGQKRLATNQPGPGEVPLSARRRDAVLAGDPATGAVLLRAIRTPEGNVLTEAGTPPRPAVGLSIDGAAWSWQPDLWSSAGFDRHFTTSREEDGSIWLILGDGVQGQAVEAAPGPDLPAERIEIAYRRGDPAQGNIGAFALNAVGRFPGDAAENAEIAALAVRSATNVRAAEGGRRPVSLEVARQLIPEAIRHPALERCVTPEDYANAAAGVPGVAQATAKPLGGLFNTIAVLVAPHSADRPDAELTEAVHSAIETRRMAGREHVVRPPDYVPLDIALLVCPAAGAQASIVREQARAALVPGTAAGPGFFHRSRIGFGAEIRLADILAAVQSGPAVGAVKALAFRPLFDAGASPVRRAIRLGPTEIAQFAGNEARPDRGRLTIRIEGVDSPTPPGAFVIAGPAEELQP